MSEALTQELQAMEARITAKLEKIVDILEQIAQNQLSQNQLSQNQLSQNPTPAQPQLVQSQVTTPQPQVIPQQLSTPESSASGTPNELESDCGIDYTQLQSYLLKKEWRKADYETFRVMMQVVGRAETDVLRGSDMTQFPCKDLRTISQLWDRFTYGQFGFRAQMAVWRNERPNWEMFGAKVGWTKNGIWIDHNQVQYHEESPKGHFPGWGNGPWLVRSSSLFPALADRMAACKLDY